MTESGTFCPDKETRLPETPQTWDDPFSAMPLSHFIYCKIKLICNTFVNQVEAYSILGTYVYRKVLWRTSHALLAWFLLATTELV